MLPKGKFELAIAPKVVASGIGLFRIGPQAELGVRYGLSERAAVGATASLLGLELSLKLPIGPLGEAVAVAVAPGIGYRLFLVSHGDTFGPGASLHTQLPVLLGIDLGYDHQLILVPRIAMDNGIPSARPETWVWVGSSIGLAIHLSPHAQLLPQVTGAYPVVQTLGGSRRFSFDFGIGLLLH